MMRHVTLSTLQVLIVCLLVWIAWLKRLALKSLILQIKTYISIDQNRR